MGQEIELKLHIDSAAQLQTVHTDATLAALFTGQPEIIRMETTYFDTADGALSAKKWTLRRRKENGVCVTCLKTPGTQTEGGVPVRGEWETTEPDFPKAIECLVADGAPEALAQYAASGVEETCSAAFVRLAQQLRLTDGSLCELACDEGVLSGGGHKRSFYELELELKKGTPEKMLALGEYLKKTYKLREEPKSKFARAHSLRG